MSNDITSIPANMTARFFKCGEAIFCPDCGALLPSLPLVGQVVSCLVCERAVPLGDFASVERKYTVVFNKVENVLASSENSKKKSKANKSDDPEAADGPTVERRCPKCGYDKMSYAALQLRSADEGQTVFFTCLKCKFKENENS